MSESNVWITSALSISSVLLLLLDLVSDMMLPGLVGGRSSSALLVDSDWLILRLLAETIRSFSMLISAIARFLCRFFFTEFEADPFPAKINYIET